MRHKPIIIALIICLAALAHAQTTAGRLAGNITDRAGSVVPGVKLTATNVETGHEVSAVSNEQGQYVLYPLSPGVYQVVAQKSGFQSLRVDGVRIAVADAVTRNLTLEVGQLEQQVTVSAQTTPLLAETQAVESTVTREQIESLPLNGRDFNQLVLLAGGAVENISSGNGKDFGSVAANGNRAFSNDYLLDGTPNNDLYQGRSGVPVSVDVIREFKVTSGVASAEYGEAGTQVSVVTRGGTNRFHGNVFEYHRGNTWEARNPFNTEAEQPFRRDQFGGSLGGPVLLPGYNGRNRTFFFFNYEGNRQKEHVTRVATVPLDEFWKGDFSALLARGIQLRDPLATGRPNIPNNRLDLYLGGARINQTAVRLRPFWGSPTLPGLANNAVRFGEETDNADQFTIRLDHQLPRNQSLTARYTRSNEGGFTPSLLANGSGLLQPVNTRNASLAWTVPFSARTVNELRFGFARYDAVTTYVDGGLPTVESLGLKGFERGNPGLPPMPRIVFSGNDAFTQLNYGSNANFGMAALTKVSNTYTLSETLTHTRGKHSFKGGFEMRRTDLPALQQSDARGRVSFSSTSTTNSTGYTFADFLIGLPSSTQEVPIKSPIRLKQTELASYVQDDWRLSSRLTLNLGLRHEIFLNPYEERNRLAMFDAKSGAIIVASDNGQLPTSEFLPAVIAKLTDASGKLRIPLVSDKDAGFAPRRLLETQYNNWGPRVGFAYQVGAQGKMIVRGGYGIFYTRYPRQYLLQTIAVNPPFAGLFNYSQTIQSLRPAFTLEAPYPTAGATASVSPAGLQRDFGLPNNQQWNLTIERNVGWGTVVSLGYVGNKGTHLFRSINANAAFLDDATKQVVRRYTSTYGTSTINFRQTDGNSIYHAMLLEVRRRVSKGVTFQANWTWAKGIDDVGSTVQAALLDVENLGRDRANSDYVRRHQINANATYELPFGRRRALLSNSPAWLQPVVAGWRLSGIWRYTTGRYFTPSFTAAGGLSNNRPDVVLGVEANLPRDQRSASRWFNPAAFAKVPAVDPATNLPRFGNAGRNTLLGPGLNVMDASLAKSFPVFGEGRKITFRLEAFNLFNHPNYDLPNANISDTNLVGTINNIVKPMRQVQFALRFDF